MVAIAIHATSPSVNPVFSAHPHSADVWIEVTQPSQILGPAVTFDYGDGTSQSHGLLLEPGTAFPNAVWKTGIFGHNYPTDGTFTITVRGDGVSTGWYYDASETQQPLPTTTQTVLVITAPKLRQYPRDDARGGAPRQGKTNGPTSLQGSTRQGWRGTYR